MSLAQRLAQVQEQIADAARKAGRKPADITLVGVTKYTGRAELIEAYNAGLRDFGENRVADAEERFAPLPYPPGAARLHFIGHLQTNKAKRAVALADVVHSVDSLRLAETLGKAAGQLNKVLPVLLEVNISGEESKEGLSPADLPALLENVLKLPNLEPCGLMTLAPYYAEPEQTRPVFARLRELFERQHPGTPAWRELSMGMTNDFQVAIEEGATLVRVGRAIFTG
jgi:PLP dependent protein